MKLRDIMELVFEDVIIYVETRIGVYEELYRGGYRDVPENLLDRTVLIVGAGGLRERVLEIEVAK